MEALDVVLTVVAQVIAVIGVILQAIVAWAIRNPGEALVFLGGFVVLLGTVIQSGTRGVLFRFGRVRRVLEPGFHPLIPWFDQVKKVHTRAHTVDVPAQRVTSADGMVYDVDANVVYRVADAIRASVEVDDYKRGVEVKTALAVQELVRRRDRAALRERADLDEELTATLGPQLARWGLELERAGLTTIAPAGHTVRLTQLEVRSRERAQALEILRQGGLSERVALGLLGASDHRLVSRSHQRYRDAQVAARARAKARAREAAPAPEARPAAAEE